MISDKVRKVYINTGNLISCKELNRRVTQSSTEEVADVLKYTLNSWLLKSATENAESSNGSSVISSSYAMKVDKEDRINLKLTLKVFVEKLSAESVNEAINEVMDHLNVGLVDSVILALPTVLSPEAWNLELVKPLWTALEKLVLDEKVTTIGVSDLDTGQLTELYNWAQVKPSVNQVNLESCCVMPPEMTAFAKENDIQLLTHNDPKMTDLIPQAMIATLFVPVVRSPSEWKTSWIARYSIIVKCRGIIQNKGYLLCTVKNDQTA